MDFDACFQIGHVIKTHGLKGDLRIHVNSSSPDNYKRLESVYLDLQGTLVPFFIERIDIKDQYAYLKLEDVDTLEQATELKSRGIYLPIDSVQDLDETNYERHRIASYQVEDQSLGSLGRILRIESSPGQDVFVMDYKNKEVLIPVSEEIVMEINHSKKSVLVALPDGLLDIYL